VADDVIESDVRQWLRDHQGRAFCARCMVRELPADEPLIRAALEVLATRQVSAMDDRLVVQTSRHDPGDPWERRHGGGTNGRRHVPADS